MQIYVRTVEGKTIGVEVEPTDSIGSVKAKIGEQEGIPDNHLQSLIFRGKLLDDACTLSDYKIDDNCTIALHVVSASLLEQSAIATEHSSSPSVCTQM